MNSVVAGFVAAAAGATGAFTAIEHSVQTAVLAGAGAGFCALGLAAIALALKDVEL